MDGAADSAAPSVCTTSEKHPAESTLPKVRQRAELDGEQSPDLVRVTDQVVVQSGNPRRAGYAPQPEQRHPLHVGAQADELGDAGLDRVHGDAGQGAEDALVAPALWEAYAMKYGRSRRC